MLGTITARKGDSACKIRVVMGNAGKSVKLCADSLYIDDIREYPIEIETESDGKRYMVNPTIFDWQSVGADCCDVVEGVVRGVTNGRTVLHGKYGDMEIQLPVIVEIGVGEKVHERFSDGASFSVTGSSAITDIRFDSSVLPVGWSDGTTLLFNLSTGRAPNIMLDKPIRFFGLPDSISIQVKNWGALINNISYEFSCSTGSWSHIVNPDADSDSVYTVSFADLDVTAFPVVLNDMKIYLSTQIKGPNQKISFRDLKAYYPHEEPDGIKEVKCGSDFSISKIDPGVIRIQGISEGEDIVITLSDMNGRLLETFCDKAVDCVVCDIELPLSHIHI